MTQKGVDEYKAIAKDEAKFYTTASIFLRRIQKVEAKAPLGLSQFLIDFLQEEEVELASEIENKTLCHDTPGSLVYRLNCMRDIFNPEFKDNISVIDDLLEIATEWAEEVEPYAKSKR